MGVVDRVHGHTANTGTYAAPAHGACLADLTQAVVLVADFADGGAAIDMHTTHLTRAQTHLGVAAFACQQHGRCTRRTRQLRALAGHHFHTVDSGPDRNVADGQRVAGTDGCILTRHDAGPDGQAARRDDVATLAIGVAHQCDMRRTVGVVLQTLHARRDTVLVATEIDDAIMALVTAATLANGDVTVVIAPGAALFRLQKAGKGSTLVQLWMHNLDHATATGRSRFDFDQCHLNHL